MGTPLKSGLRVVAGLLVVGVAACTLVTSLDGFTCSGTECTDVATDSAPQADTDAPADGQAEATDASVDRTDAASDAIADVVAEAFTYVCPDGGPVTSCGSCAAAAFPCVLCASAGADTSKVIGLCVTSATSGSACQGRGPAGYDDCLCATPADPSPCTAGYQVCLLPNGPACRTCGYDGSVGVKCKGGGNCSAAGVCE